MVSEVTDLVEGAARDAVNGIIVRGGAFIRRDGETLVAVADAHSGWTAPDGTTYAISNSQLCSVSLDTNGDPVLTPLGLMPSNNHASFADLNGSVLVSNVDGMRLLTSTGLQPFGVEMPGGYFVTPQAGGGLDAGRYGVALSFVSTTGEEGGMSDSTYVDVAEGQKLWVSMPTPIEASTASVNIYCTGPNGEDFHFIKNIPTGLWGAHIDASDDLGELADNQLLERLPSGRFICLWQGRLLVARGRTLYYSEPLRYGLYHPAHNFVQLPQEIGFVGALPDGIFLGTLEGTFYLDGQNPAEWKIKKVDTDTPLLGGCQLLSVEAFSREEELFPAGVDYVIAWLGSGGFHFGLPSGTVLRPQNDKINLDLLGTSGTVQLVGDVLIAILF